MTNKSTDKPGRSIRKFFQSKSTRERQELERDRQRRRRSFVELDVEDEPRSQWTDDSRDAAVQPSVPRNRGVPRSLRSISSHASSYSEHPSIWRRAWSGTGTQGAPPTSRDTNSVASGPSTNSVEPATSQRSAFPDSGFGSPVDSRQSSIRGNPALRNARSTDSLQSATNSVSSVPLRCYLCRRC